MQRIKLYVVEEWSVDKWEPRYLQRGKFEWVLNKAQAMVGLHSRVRRVKTPGERDQYQHLDTLGIDLAITEWVGVDARAELDELRMFVFERLKNGIWEPWFIQQSDFRKCLRQTNTEEDVSIHRIRRVETRDKLEEYILGGITVRCMKIIEDWIWRVEWVN